jgi:hypothetical protein
MLLNAPNPPSYTMVMRLAQPLTEMSIRNRPWVNFGCRVRLSATPPSVSQLSIKCLGLDVQQPNRSPWPVTELVLLLFILLLITRQLFCLMELGGMNTWRLVGFGSLTAVIINSSLYWDINHGHLTVCRIWGSHGHNYKKFYLLRCKSYALEGL